MFIIKMWDVLDFAEWPDRPISKWIVQSLLQYGFKTIENAIEGRSINYFYDAGYREGKRVRKITNVLNEAVSLVIFPTENFMDGKDLSEDLFNFDKGFEKGFGVIRETICLDDLIYK